MVRGLKNTEKTAIATTIILFAALSSLKTIFLIMLQLGNIYGKNLLMISNLTLILLLLLLSSMIFYDDDKRNRIGIIGAIFLIFYFIPISVIETQFNEKITKTSEKVIAGLDTIISIFICIFFVYAGKYFYSNKLLV